MNRLFASLVLGTFAVFFTSGRRVLAATITVDDLSDASGGTTCTLRNAITASNSNVSVGGCPAGTLGLDTIRFNAAGTITLGLNSAPLVIAEDLELDGPGPENLLIDISLTYMSPNVVINSGSTVTIDGLKLGYGPFSNDGTLTATNSTLWFCGVGNSGTLTVNDSTLVGSSISNRPLGSGDPRVPALTFRRSSLSGSAACGAGGGLYNEGTALIVDSTLSGNSVFTVCDFGGCCHGAGAGIYNAGSGMLTVNNSTLSGNSAAEGGGGILNAGTLALNNSTLSGNGASMGGGLLNVGALTVNNTIIANSPSGGNCAGTLAGADDNLSDDATCSGFTVASPMLGPLQVYPPGTTATFALLDGSPAIDSGNDTTCLSTDQRGVARPQGAHCDAGAFEGAVTTTTSTSSSTSTTIPAPDPCDPAPATGCHQAASLKSSLTIVDNATDPTKRAFKWRWKAAPTDVTAIADFKNPPSGMPAVRVCLYDRSASSQPRMEARILTGGTCAGNACWTPLGAGTAPVGYRYRNKATSPDGLTDAKLKAGQAGKAQVSVKGKGSLLPDRLLGLTSPVTVQLVTQDGGGTACWQASLGTVVENTSTQFKAKGP